MSPQGVVHVVQNSADAAPAGITAGPDGNLWYTDQKGKIVRVTPSGVITEYPLPVETSAPLGIIAGSDGFLWFTETSAPNVGRISMGGMITEFALPSTDRTSYGIALGPDGNIWFTESSVDGLANWIGRITSSGAVTEFPIPTAAIGPSQIAAGPDGNLWFTEPGYSIASSKLGRINLAGSITEFTVPTMNCAPAGITAGPDGNIWFTEGTGSKIGRVNLGQLPGCEPTTTALCLASGRFRVESQWRRPTDSAPSAGHAVSITPDTGYFWFFDASNAEVVAKVLNGCQVDSSYWFFAGGLTNVEVTLTVTDTKTTVVKTYTNPQGTAFLPIQDTVAFACP